MRFSLTVPRFSCQPMRALWLFAMLLSAGSVWSAPGNALPVSQVSVTGSVEIAAIQEKLRQLLADTVSSEWQETSRELDLGKLLGKVGAVIRYRVRPSELILSADSGGSLRIRIPIRIRPEPNSSGLVSLGVKKTGCGESDFHLTVVVTPRFSNETLAFEQQDPVASSGGYRCVIGPNKGGRILTLGRAKPVDVARQIRSKIESRAKKLLKDSAGHVNRVLVADGKLRRMVSQPVELGAGVRLGIDFRRIRPLRLIAEDKVLKLEGIVEGRPWLDFGQKPKRAAMAEDASLAQGFHLPAVLMFPTDSALLPAAGPRPAGAVKERTFRLRRVPDRTDLVVLQRYQETGRDNVIWLSDGSGPEGQKELRFDQPMTGVLDQIIAWLNEPELWQDVPGVQDLKTEVEVFRRLVEQFQRETTLSLGETGTLHFSQLDLDLISIRVSREAIWADVALRGQARLDIPWHL